MNGKYYTPKIEEFCLGFEFEYFIRNQTDEGFDPEWRKSTVVLDNTEQARIKGLTFPILENLPIKYYQIGLALKNKTIRAKYLDKEDFTELGWMVDPDGDYVLKIPKGKKERWFIMHDPETHRLEVGDLEHEFGFAGKIYNKTQLKQLLKHLI